MPILAYCRKCKEEVAQGEVCALCGGKLSRTSLRASWGVTYHPLTDWFAWNAPLRIGIPVVIMVGLMILFNEMVQSGSIGLQIVLKTWFFPLMGALLLALCSATLLGLLVRGKELHYFILDQKGIQVQIYKHNRKNEPEWALRIDRHLLWSEVRRIHALAERNAVLLYAPSWWHAMTLYCDSESYRDALTYIKKRTGKSKDIRFTRPPEGLEDIT